MPEVSERAGAGPSATYLSPYVRGTSPAATERTEESRVSTPLDLLTRPSSGRPPVLEEEVGLDAVLALFADVRPASTRRTLRRSGAHLRGWARTSSRRAAAWGAVVPPAVSAGTRSDAVATEVGQ